MAARQEQRPVLLERAQELAATDLLLADAAAGSGRLVIVEGLAGIGKSSVLAEATARGAEAGLTVLGARGTEIERPFSYGVVRQLFERRVAHAAPDERAALFEGAAAHARALFEADRFAEPLHASEDVAFSLMHGLYWLAANLAEVRPLLVSVDDLQWADDASLRFLAYLARRLEGVAAAVLAAVRPLEQEDPVLAELLADTATTVVRPSALTTPAAAELVRATLAPEADDAFCSACHRTTGGNPLLLRELVRTLAAEEIAPSAASVEVVERLAPDAVARSVRLRLARLPVEAGALAHAVAVLGDGTEGRYAAELAGLEKRALAPTAASLARADLLRGDPPLRFVHPVVRNAVYEMRAPHERSEEHARAAAILAAASAPVEEVAGQLLLASPESVEDAVAPLTEAARRAARQGAPAGAARYLRRALQEPMDDARRGELLVELAASESSLGAPAVVEHLQEAVRLLRDPGRRAVAELELGRALYWAGNEEAGVEVLETSLGEREAIDDDLRRRLQAELFANSLRLPSHYEDARRRLWEIHVRPDQGPGARLLLSIQAYDEGARGGDRAAAGERATRALTAMDDDERAWNYTTGCYSLLHGDRLDHAVALLDPLIDRVRRSGAVFNFAGLSMTRAIFHYARGALVEAEADARTALDALPHPAAWFVPHSHGWLAQVLVERGELDQARDLLQRVAPELTAPSDPFSSTPLLRARAVLAAARGEHRAARDEALALGRALAAFGHDNPAVSYPAWRSLAAQAHHALGEADEALALATEEAELARAWGAPRTLGGSLRVLGSLRGGDEGLALLREAVGLLEASPARLEHAYALADLGAALRRGNRRADAREPLREALELSQRLGARVLADRAHEELVATGARPRRLVMSGVDALTPSERRIAAMAAEGLSNRDIAQALFLTLRTVEMHLSNAFRKLDIASRTQLPTALAASAGERVATSAA